ncbi:hypothetical protein V8C44DRAFT_352352 [Trichoderma aethiopicum]
MRATGMLSALCSWPLRLSKSQICLRRLRAYATSQTADPSCFPLPVTHAASADPLTAPAQTRADHYPQSGSGLGLAVKLVDALQKRPSDVEDPCPRKTPADSRRNPLFFQSRRTAKKRPPPSQEMNIEVVADTEGQ